MATSGVISDPYSGRTMYRLELYVWRHSTSGTSARWSWTLRAIGSGGSWCNDPWYWQATIEGQTWSGNANLDFRSTSNKLIASGTTGWINQGGGTPYIDMYCRHGWDPCGVFGMAEASGGFTADRLATAPGKPAAPVFTSATPTVLNFTLTAPSNGGVAIDNYGIQVATDSGFSNIVESWNSTSLTQQVDDLTPSTSYYVRYRAHNSVGWGSYSNSTLMTTLPATPPGISVVAGPSGQTATVNLTPPGGITGVNSYDIQRRLQGSGTVVDASTLTNQYEVGGLTPGATYEWRARANIGSYQSPWTGWTALTQPNPSTNPGDFFDGNSVATDDVTFSWTGTANNSPSVATGVGVEGWEILQNPANSAVLQQVTGGHTQQHAARLIRLVDADNSDLAMAQSEGHRSEVVAGETYTASAYVSAGQDSVVMTSIAFYDADGDPIIAVSGGSMEVPAGGGWIRALATGDAPANAVEAAVTVRFVQRANPLGEALSGDWIAVDSAMVNFGGAIPYFDGNTPDTPTLAYTWEGATNASPSRRTTLVVPEPNPLADPDCDPLPAPPRPPVVLDSCIEDVVTWRRYWSGISSTEVAYWLEEIPTLQLHTDDQPARQVRIRIYPNPDELPLNEIDPSSYTSEQIISYIPPNTEMTLDGVLQRAFASVNGAPPVAADHLLYGTGGVPATWPTLTCGQAYAISFDVDVESSAGNISTQVILTRRG